MKSVQLIAWRSSERGALGATLWITVISYPHAVASCSVSLLSGPPHSRRPARPDLVRHRSRPHRRHHAHRRVHLARGRGRGSRVDHRDPSLLPATQARRTRGLEHRPSRPSSGRPPWPAQPESRPGNALRQASATRGDPGGFFFIIFWASSPDVVVGLYRARVARIRSPRRGGRPRWGVRALRWPGDRSPRPGRHRARELR